MKFVLDHPVFRAVSDIVTARDAEAFVIGGYVRDVLLGRESKDIDIVVAGSGIQLARQTAKALGGNLPVSVFKNFGTAMFRYEGCDIEFVGARKESYRGDSRKPEVQEGTLEEDQQRRDFTINALAVGLHQKNYGVLIDPFGGVDDLRRKIIRTPLEPGITFSDDPLRMMRAVRFASQLGFRIRPDAFAAISENKERIAIVSKERIADELHKMVLSPKPSVGFLLLDQCGLLPLVFPELSALKGVEVKNGKAHKDNFLHTLKVLDNLSLHTDKLWLRWAALMHDMAKPATRRYVDGVGWTFHGHEFLGAKMVPGIFRSLKLPLNDHMKYVQKLVLLHLRPIVLSQDEVTDSAVRRLLFEAGEDVEDLMLLCEADITSANDRKVRTYLRNFLLVREKMVELEQKDAIRAFQPPVSGSEIMELFGLPPGPQIGALKNALKDAVLDGMIPNEAECARAFLLEKAKELGISVKR